MPPHSINLFIVKTEPVMLASLSISHYLSRRGVLPAHTSAGLDMQTLAAIHQLQPTLPHNYEPQDWNTIRYIYHGPIVSAVYGNMIDYLSHVWHLIVQISMQVHNSKDVLHSMIVGLFVCIV